MKKADAEAVMTCWKVGWNQWKPDEDGPIVATLIVPNEDPETSKIPEPWATIIERCSYADAAVFETFAEVKDFHRPLVTGEAWPRDVGEANSVRVTLLGTGLRVRFFFFNPDTE